MQNSWIGQNVNLSTLVKEIIQFLEAKEFDDVTALKTERGFQVIAGGSNRYKMDGDVCLAVEGSPNDFSLSLKPCAKERKQSLPLILTSMFGGGYFLLKNFKSDEAMLKLERDFGQNIGNMIQRSREPRSQET